MKISLQDLLLELSTTEIRNKFYSDINLSAFNSIVSADPRTKVRDGEVVKVGKYGKILLTMYKKGNLKLEDLPKATEYLEIIYKKQLGIPHTLDNLNDLFDIVAPFIIKDGETDIHKLVSSLGDGDYELLFEDEQWYIFKPKTQKGDCVLGSGSEWCTTWGDLSTNPHHRDRSSHFPRYSNSGNGLFIVVNKEDNKVKYQFHEESGQFMDINDRGINIKQFLDTNPSINQFFNPALKDLVNASDGDMDSAIGRKMISEGGVDAIVNELTRRYGGKPIVPIFVEAKDTDNLVALNDAINTTDFYITDFYNGWISFKNLDDEDLAVYDSLGYNNSDSYVDEEDVSSYIEYNMDDIFQKKIGAIRDAFNANGIDIEEFLKYLKEQKNGYADGVNKYFMMKLISDCGKQSDFEQIISGAIGSAKDDALKEASYDVQEKVDNLFKITNSSYEGKQINENIFFLFLIRNDYYDMDSFKDFLSATFNIATESYQIYEEVDELARELESIDEKDILSDIENLIPNMVEWFMDAFDDEVIKYHQLDNEDSRRWAEITDEREYEIKLQMALGELKQILIANNKDHNPDTEMSNEARTLTIFPNKINIPNKLVYINFMDNNTYKSVNDYVRFDQLAYYINYKDLSKVFYDKLDGILKSIGLDRNKNEVENELVKLKLFYDRVNYEDETIFIELTQKSNNETLSGTVKIDSLPTHFRNYKLFESYLKYFKNIL